MDHNALKKRAFSGILWNLAESISSKSLAFVIQIVLARAVAPDQFGILGMVMVFITISEAIADCGMTNALIREANTTKGEYSLVFFINLGVSTILYGSIVLLSGAISRFYNEPLLTRVIPVLASTLIINAVGSIQKTMLTKRLAFRVQMIVYFISYILAGAAAIFLAYRGAGVWALVVNTVMIHFISAVLFSVYTKWVPTLRLETKSFRKYFGFGWKILIASIISALYENIYSVIIGKSYNAQTLGYYTNASKLQNVASSVVAQSLQKVSYPVLSRFSDDDGQLKTGFRKIIMYAMYASFPFMYGLLAVASTFIPMALGEKWSPAIPYFMVLCLSGAFIPLHRLNLNLLYVKGFSNLVLRLEIIKKGIAFTLIAIAVLLKTGIPGLLAALLMYDVVSLIINTFYTKRIIGYSIVMQIRDILKPFVFAAIMVCAVLAAGHYLDLSRLPLLMIQILIGIMVYGCLVLLFAWEVPRDLLSIIKDRKAKAVESE